MTRESVRPLEKVALGIPGFDTIAEGGVPRGRTTLVAGTAGSGKTLFTTQFLAEGIMRHDEDGVFVTLEDSVDDIRRNMASFHWDIPAWEEEGRWAFVDGAPRAGEESVVVGSYDLEALLARILSAVERVGAQRVTIDSINALFAHFPDPAILRNELFRITSGLKDRGVTTLITAERQDDYGDVTRSGVEEFVTDNVIILRHILQDERRRRTIEILKFRGAVHQNGEYPFTISSEQGVIVIPLSAIKLAQSSSTVRVSTGNETLDELCGGGFFRDSIILVSGATGTGKTLTVTQFLDGGAKKGERCLLFAFEESRDQLVRNAAAWGMDFSDLLESDQLRILNVYPHAVSLEDHLVAMKDEIAAFKPNRVAVDSLSALERVGTVRSFREFVINLTATIKKEEIAGMFTSTTTSLAGGEAITEKHISTLTDTIILLRYVERSGHLRRGLTVLKMRGSEHDRQVREYTIEGDGMHIGAPFDVSTGILGSRQVVTRETVGTD